MEKGGALNNLSVQSFWGINWGSGAGGGVLEQNACAVLEEGDNE